MLRIAIILILAASEINSAAADVTVVGPTKPLIDVPTKYSCNLVGGAVAATTNGYEWTVLDANAVQQNSNEYLVTVASTSTTQSGEIKCVVTLTDGTTKEQNTLEVEAVTMTPTITQDKGDPGTFQKEGAYSLTCDSPASKLNEYKTGATWAWKKGTVPIPNAETNEFKIKSALKADEAIYTCKITIPYPHGTGATPPNAESADFEVDVVDELGVYCVNDDVCAKLAKANYTGACETKTKRCVCTGNVKPEGCDAGKDSGKDSGTSAVLASLSMTISVAMVMVGRLL